MRGRVRGYCIVLYRTVTLAQASLSAVGPPEVV